MSLSPTPHDRRLLVGRYEIRRKLGSGSLGAVYQAWDQAEERLVALKVLRTEQLLANALPRIQEEFRAIASLRHPQIARAHDFGFTEEEDLPFFTREYIEGTPLPAGPPGSDEPAAFLKPILDLLEALEYVHEQGILHLDIHAGNLIVADDTRRGSVLIDFGLAKSIENPLVGTSAESWPAIPPELLGHGRPGVAADIFLVGRLLLYRLTGQNLGKPGLPREIVGWGTRLTLDLERIAAKALQFDPADRFATAVELRDALGKALGQRPRRARHAEPQQLLLGRDAELRQVDDLVRAAADGAAGVLWLVSRPGLGKSRLLSEARLRSQLRGLRTVHVRFAVPEGPGPALLAALRKVRSGRREFLAWLEPLAPSFGGRPDERAQRAAAAYFTDREAPLVLVLDDLDGADRESRMLVDALVAECRRRSTGERTGRGIAIFVSAARSPAAGSGAVKVRSLEPLGAATSRELFLALLRPLSAPEGVIREALARARGSPLRLRQLALALRDAWRPCRAIPPTAEIPPALPGTPGTALEDWESLSSRDHEVMKVLAICDRPVSLDELAAALQSQRAGVSRSVRRLEGFEVVAGQGRRRRRRFRVASREAVDEILARVSVREAKAVHGRMAAFLERLESPSLSEREGLARHRLAMGRRTAGVRLAVDAARELRAAGAYDRAVRLLEVALLRETTSRLRLGIAEEISAILSEIGDDRKAVEILEPAFRARRRRTRREAVRLGRCLGIHSHRAGFPDKALDIFEATQELADERRDREDLIYIDSELAELHIFQGDYDAAERACERGLERLADGSGSDEFHGRMEVMLRASRGHIELRKLRFDAAREEFVRALRGSRRFAPVGDRAAILHNLGVLENQANRFCEARRYFEEAERLLTRAGERQNLIKISTNLALIEAKIGRREIALDHLERAAGLLRHHAGQRLECFVAYSRAVVLLHFGECEEAIDAFRAAISLARRLRDRQLKRFAEIYLAESYLLIGRYKTALSLLRRTPEENGAALAPFFERMALCRIYLAESVLCRSRAARKALERLEAIPRTDVLYLETWNDLLLAVGHLASGRESLALLDGARRTFHELGVAAGERLAALGLLVEALGREDTDRIRSLAEELERRPPVNQRFLRTAEPVVLAAVFVRLQDLQRADRHLAVAAGNIVGAPFLEVDWQLEFLRARLALKRGEIRETRRHLHRCLHCRDLLTQFVPGSCRDRFLGHGRFRALNEVASRLNLHPVAEHSTERLRRLDVFEGMVGRSAATHGLFQSIERLREQDVAVVITGETGSGKDLAASSIHRSSLRGDQPLTVIACACLPNELFESELFGHVAGAFTGAETDQPGLLERADRGTALLADVDQLAPESQAKLLRVLESGSIRKLGSPAARRVDVRFLATTSADLGRLAEQGLFRRDLYYRLAGVELRIPPLRERREDIPLLTRHFLEQHAQRLDRGVSRIDPEALELLATHDWPGNVRELESFLFRLLISLSRPETITLEDVSALITRDPFALFKREATLLEHGIDDWRRELEREYLTRLFIDVGGDVRAMMKRLGVRSTKLYDWLRSLGLKIRDLRERL